MSLRHSSYAVQRATAVGFSVRPWRSPCLCGYKVVRTPKNSARRRKRSRAATEINPGQIAKTDQLIRDVGYEGEIFFRPPYAKKLFALPYYLAKTGRTSITWDVEPDSFPEIAANSDKIVQYVLSTARPGSIIILDVMYPSRIESLKAVPKII